MTTYDQLSCPCRLSIQAHDNRVARYKWTMLRQGSEAVKTLPFLKEITNFWAGLRGNLQLANKQREQTTSLT